MTASNKANAESRSGKDDHCLRFTESEARYERKFYLPELSEHEVLVLLKRNPAIFKEIFYKRLVNNLYLDTANLRNYTENVVGAQHRLKVRIRWYGELLGDIARPTLEIKIKNGLSGIKKSYRLPPLHIEPGFRFQEWLNIFRSSGVPDSLRAWLAAYEPTLINCYARRYFISADRIFRVTVDSEMRFGALGRRTNLLLHWAEKNTDTVLELKYATEHDLVASEVTSLFPFRLTKSSKYVIGIDAVKSSCGQFPKTI